MYIKLVYLIEVSKAIITTLACLPDLFARDQLVRLTPEQNLGQVPEIPAIRHRPMAGGWQSGDERRLHGTGHRWRDGVEGPHPAPRCQFCQIWRMFADQ